MTRAHEGDRRDLFDFPEVEGLEEFGLVPPLPDGVQAEVTHEQAELATPPVDTPEATQAAPAAQSAPGPADADEVQVSPARPNPPVPAGIDDLDEDLFHFDEVFSLEEDPYFNGTLSLDGSPASTLFLDESEPEPLPDFGGLGDPLLDDEPAEAFQPAPRPVPPPAEPTIDLDQPIHTEREPAAASAPEPALEPAPARPSESELPETITPAPRPAPEPASAAETGPAPRLMASSASAAPAALTNGTSGTTVDRGPRLLLPEDVPYSATGERQRYVLALIACFLLVNTGIFFVAQQASSSFNHTMSEATGLLADALAQRTSSPAQAAAPVIIAPEIVHTIEEPEDEPPFRPEAWVDPTNYANTHEFAVGNAKALLAEGRFEDARRLLNHVLANQSRIPLATSLREEIDYLIPLTYYEQGNATAPEVPR